MTRAFCKGCGAKIIWATLPDGGRVPLDPAAPVYSIDVRSGTPVATRVKEVYVSHFATCTKAADFSHERKDCPA